MPVRISVKLLGLVLPGVLSLAACGGLEWPPPRMQSRASQMPPLAAQSPSVPSLAPSAIRPPVDETVVVERGDSIHTIARRQQVSLQALADANNLQPPYRLNVGQRLSVPRSRDHYVAAGENIDTIAIRYGIDRYDLARANNVRPPYELHAGQRLTLPPSSATVVAATSGSFASVGGPPPASQRSIDSVPLASIPTMPLPPPSAGGTPPQAGTLALTPPPAPVAAPVLARTQPPEPVELESDSIPTSAEPIEVAAAMPSAPLSGPRRGFQWPVVGKVISHFGDKAHGMRNDGVNIAAPKGSPVVAVESGVVTYAGNELRGFGNLILIKHDDGWITAYAHTDALLVKRGDEVKKGQAIAKVGATGNVREPQLHFEMRRGKSPVDPLRHLPRARA